MQKGFAPIIILLVILVFIVLGGGAYYYSKQSLLPSPSQTVTNPSLNLQNDNCKTATYTNSKIGFSMNYFVDHWGPPQERDNYIYFGLNQQPKDKTMMMHLVDSQSVDMLAINQTPIKERMEKWPGHWIDINYENLSTTARRGPPNSQVIVSHLTVDGKPATKLTGETLVEYEHGSGVDYNGPKKSYLFEDIIIKDEQANKITNLSYLIPKDDPVPCSFDPLLSSVKFVK